MNIVISCSTYPASDDDPVSGFVADQALAMLELNSELTITVLVPHTAASLKTHANSGHERLCIKRFHYFWPHRLETLTDVGIMPTLSVKPWMFVEVPFLLLFTIVNLYGLTRKLKPAYMYAHWFTPQGIAASIVSRTTKVPYVLTSHSSDVYIWRKCPLIGKWIVRWFISNCRAVTVVSRRTKEKLQSFYTPGQWERVAPNVRILPMGIHLPESGDLSEAARDALRRQYDLGASSCVFLFMGRLTEKKGLQILLPAFAELLRSREGVKLLIAGEGEMKRSLLEQARRLEVTDHVVFTGFVHGVEKQALFDVSDVLVVPSIVTAKGDAEGLPVALLEGLAAGKLSIATDVSGADDIVTDGREAFLIQPGHVQELKLAMLRAMDMDDSQKSTMSDEARRLAGTFAWPVIARRHYEFFKHNTDV
jgi:glycosyltransferase involved in cell wall biosynthesis